MFGSKTKKLQVEGSEDSGIEEKWRFLKKTVLDAAVKKEIKIKKWSLGMKRWWDRSCSGKKRSVKRAYNKWRRGEYEKEKYTQERKELMQLYKEKEKEKKEAELQEIRMLKNENDIWSYLMGKEKKKVKVENRISAQEWKEHFRELLECAEERKLGEARKMEEEDKEEISQK